MAITLSTTARNAANNAVVTLANSGHLVLLSGSTALCTINLAATAFTTSSNGSVSANGLPISGSASNSGTADGYRVETSGSTSLWTGTVGVGTGDLQASSLSITSGQIVTINSWAHVQIA